MSETLLWSDIGLRLCFSIAAGMLIGLDRSVHAHPAGLRTTVLISLAATVAMIQANWLVVHMSDTHISIVRLDMMRLPLGILSGIGFIGAGAIIRRGDVVRGITTAATIWLVTVVGLCFGGGQIGLGAAATAIGYATLWILKHIEGGILTGRRGTIAITVAGEFRDEAALCALLTKHGFQMRSRRVELVPGARMQLVCNGRYKGPYPGWSQGLLRELALQSGVSVVEWRDTD
jgi:putative Mg2+ transporter-C (MgtC) family protein